MTVQDGRIHIKIEPNEKSKVSGILDGSCNVAQSNSPKY